MFRRRWSGLPPDPFYPADFKKLGYFIHSSDEIRSIDNPDFYFHYFLTKNERHNDRRRFALEEAIREEVLKRLEFQGLKPLWLPLEAHDVKDDRKTISHRPRVPIYFSCCIQKPRIIVIFGDSEQDLGVIAHRVLGGKGGVDKGSMVSIVKAIRNTYGGNGWEDGRPRDYVEGTVTDKWKGWHPADPADSGVPGIIIANTGELYWWKRGGRSLTARGRNAMPMSSSAMLGSFAGDGSDGEGYCIPGNRTPLEHVESVFEGPIGSHLDARYPMVIDVIGVGNGGEAAVKYLDQNWGKWSHHMGCMALLGSYHDVHEQKSEGFKKFLRERTRAYVPHQEPHGTVLSDWDGNPNSITYTDYGCPLFSINDGDLFQETALVHGHPMVLEWMKSVADAGPDYKNPAFEAAVCDRNVPIDTTWGPEDVGTPPTGDSWPSDVNAAPQSGLQVMSSDDFENRRRAAAAVNG